MEKTKTNYLDLKTKVYKVNNEKNIKETLDIYAQIVGRRTMMQASRSMKDKIVGNGKFSYRYSSLSSMKSLTEQVFLQNIVELYKDKICPLKSSVTSEITELGNNIFSVRLIFLISSHEDNFGIFIHEMNMSLPNIFDNFKNNDANKTLQTFGSFCTYSQRYLYKRLLNIADVEEEEQIEQQIAKLNQVATPAPAPVPAYAEKHIAKQGNLNVSDLNILLATLRVENISRVEYSKLARELEIYNVAIDKPITRESLKSACKELIKIKSGV